MYSKSEVIQKIFSDIIGEFNYSIISGIEEYPLKYGRDLDILVEGKYLSDIFLKIKSFLVRKSIRYIIPPKIWGYRIIIFFENEWDEVFEIHLIHKIQLWNNVLYKNPVNLLTYEHFKIDPIAYYVKKKLIPLFFKKKIVLKNDFIFAEHFNRIEAYLRIYFSKRTVEKIIKSPDSVNSSQLKLEYIINSIKKKPYFTIFYPFKFLYRFFYNSFIPYLPIFAVVGPDGSGKSTILDKIENGSKSIFLNIIVKHWRPQLIPNIGYFFGKKITPDRDGLIIPRNKPGKFSTLRILYYSLDFLLGYYIIDRQISSRQKLILYDRCLLDITVDPVRFGIKKNSLLLKILKILPKPDFYILLMDNPEKIFERKPELSAEEIKRQFYIWENLLKENKQKYLIVNGGSIKEREKLIKNYIMESIYTFSEK